MRLLAAALLLLSSSSSSAASAVGGNSSGPLVLSGAGGVRVLIDGATASAAGALLSRVLPELAGVLDAVGAAAARAPGGAPLDVSLSLSPAFRRSSGAAAERCAHGALAGGGASAVCGGLLGLAYALHDLRESLALAGAGGAARVVAAFASGPARAAPAYGMRFWSEEAQLLGLPDRGYYLPDGSGADVAAIAGEAAALEAELVPALLRLRMNALIVLHSDIEDYVTYDALPQFLPGAPPVYAAGDAHRARRAGVVGVMAPFIQRLKDDYGIAFFIKVYEFSSPPGVCTAASNASSALFNCSLDSPATAALVKAKYTELAAALPALAGVIVTVEDSWSPRAGYVFNVLWSGNAELPRVVTLFYDAIVATVGLQMWFRLWLFGAPVDWPTLAAGSPTGARFSVKQTQGDFLLDFPINALLTCGGAAPGACPPAQRRMVVEVDAFRQYNGYGAGLAWLGSQWAPRLAAARAAAGGAPQDVWGWGSWAPGCTWPDSGPTLVNATAGTFKSWRSWWNQWRLFNGTAANGGFSLSGQANAYLLYRLSWDAPAPPAAANETAIAQDFGTLFYGAGNADAIAQLLAASFHAWLPTSSPSALGDFTLFWTHMQHDVGTFAKLAGKFNVSQFDAAAAASAAAVADMRAALARVDPALVPAAFHSAYAGAAASVSVTQKYLRAYFGWRAAGLVVAQLGAAPAAAACADARARVAELAAAAADFGAAHPVASATWVVDSLDPALYSHPPFLTSSQRTMAGFVAPWLAQIAAACPAAAPAPAPACSDWAIDAREAVAETAPYYASFNIDSSRNRAFFGIDWASPTLAAAVANLAAAPAHVRFGGTGNNFLYYDVGAAPPCPRDHGVECLNETTWSNVASVAARARAPVIFGVNMNATRTRTAFDPANAVALFTWLRARGDDIFGVELGNEINEVVTAAQQAAGLLALDDALAGVYGAAPRPRLVGPDALGLHTPAGGGGVLPTSVILQYMQDFVTATRGRLFAVTHHEYIEINATNVVQPAFLDINAQLAALVVAAVRNVSADVQIWAGEIGPHNGNSAGSPVPDCAGNKVCGRFGSLIWYADAMCAKARAGYAAFCRQDLIGADYGLLNLTSLAPTPDFFFLALWQRLVGARVLAVTPPADNALVRAYGFCGTKNSTVTLVLINLGNESACLAPPGIIDLTKPRMHYALTASDGAAGVEAPGVRLNGALLALGAGGALPPLPGQPVPAAVDITLPPLSVNFVSFQSPADACGGPAPPRAED